MKIIMVKVVILAATLMVKSCTEAATYSVGDGMNWIQPPTLTTYSIWASSHVFVKGDILVFNFNNGIHDVAEVTREAYKQCNTTSPISIHTQSPVRISLPKRGRRYFISTLNNDCNTGQKLAIRVLNELPPPSPSPSPSPASSPALGPNSVASPLPITVPSPLQNASPSFFGHSYISSVLISLSVMLLFELTF